MSENNKQRIVVTLNTRRVPLVVELENEPFYRQAAETLNELFVRFQREHPMDRAEYVWQDVALAVAYNLYKDRKKNVSESCLDAIQHINEEIENKLNNK
ncbi:MAG: cell division protein ZapA [Paludibacteraceae bacterium]|nr:cell division protein ZapA [Paludibacteraceae bacterium]